MSFLDEAIYERDNSLEREVIDGDDNPFGVVGSDDDDDDENKKNDEVVEKVEPKKVHRRVSTQPRLNPEKLTGPRGIHKIEDEFKNVKFKGKGHETQDLDLIMKRLAHWSHRLFPKYNFDDCLMAIETQGKKKPVQHFMNKYRNDALDDDIVQNVIESDEENENRDANFTAPQMEPDEFDQMLSEQISKTTNFNQTLDSSLGVRELESSSFSSQRPSSTLSEEQMKRMEENRLRALEIRKKRMMEQSVAQTADTNETRTDQESSTQNFANQDIDMSDLMSHNEPNEDELELMNEMDV